MVLRFVAVVVCCLSVWVVQADEGMWMLGNLNKQTRRAMKELGLANAGRQAIQCQTSLIERCRSEFRRFLFEGGGRVRKTDWYLRITIAVSVASSSILPWSMTI